MPHNILAGCRPEPLAGYLKALAVFRLIAEQKDSGAKGWWQDNVFHLESTDDEAGLVQFFVQDYSPTPVVAPWNGGSGFYEGDKIGAREAIRKSTHERFAEYRSTLDTILSWDVLPPVGQPLKKLVEVAEGAASQNKGKKWDDLREHLARIRTACLNFEKTAPGKDLWGLSVEDIKSLKPSSPAVKELYRLSRKLRTEVKGFSRKAGKELIIQMCRSKLSDRAIKWIDAAVMLGTDQEISYPPLLGSGGNEGRLDYTNTFMACVSDLWLENNNNERVTALLRNALFSASAAGLVKKPVGQYDPGRAGGYNQGPGIEDKEFPINPWDFLLTLEGAIPWAPGIARRNGGIRGVLCSPFTVHSRPVGYLSSTNSEAADARAEIWAPLWSRPATYAELTMLLSEGRAEVGTRRRANNSIDFAKAAASLGVDRGIGEFVRYSLLKRRGDSYAAVPAGRFPVQFRTESDLIRDLDGVLNRLDRWLGTFPQQEASARYSSARRGIDLALYEVLLHGGPLRMKTLVAAIGRLEKLLAGRDLNQRPKLNAPLSGISPYWLLAVDDGSPEIRLAAALVSIGPTGRVGPLRANLAPIDPKKPWAWSQGGTQVKWHGNTLAARLAGVLFQRMMDADRFGTSSNPLHGLIPLHAEDIASFIDENIDEALLEDLLFGLTWVQWHDKREVETAVGQLRDKWSKPITQRVVPRPWALLKLLFLAGPLIGPSREKLQIRAEPALIPLLRAGRVREACEIAQRRLTVSGVSPCRISYPDSPNGERLAGTLLFAVRNTNQLLRFVCNRD